MAETGAPISGTSSTRPSKGSLGTGLRESVWASHSWDECGSWARALWLPRPSGSPALPQSHFKEGAQPPLIKPGRCQEVGDGGTRVGTLPSGLTFQDGVSSEPPSSSAWSSPSAWSCPSVSSSPSASSSDFRLGCCCQRERDRAVSCAGAGSPAPWQLSPEAKSSQWAEAWVLALWPRGPGARTEPAGGCGGDSGRPGTSPASAACCLGDLGLPLLSLLGPLTCTPHRAVAGVGSELQTPATTLQCFLSSDSQSAGQVQRPRVGRGEVAEEGEAKFGEC